MSTERQQTTKQPTETLIGLVSKHKTVADMQQWIVFLY